MEKIAKLLLKITSLHNDRDDQIMWWDQILFSFILYIFFIQVPYKKYLQKLLCIIYAKIIYIYVRIKGRDFFSRKKNSLDFNAAVAVAVSCLFFWSDDDAWHVVPNDTFFLQSYFETLNKFYFFVVASPQSAQLSHKNFHSSNSRPTSTSFFLSSNSTNQIFTFFVCHVRLLYSL